MNRKNIDTYIYANVCPKWLILLVDTFIIIASLVFAFVVRDGIESKIGYDEIYKGIIIVIPLNVFCLYLFKIPSRLLRYSTFFDFLRIAIAQTFAFVILSILNVFIQLIPAGVLPIIYVMSTVLLISLRIAVKVGFEFRSIGRRDTIRVMIYAAESKGADLVRRLRGDSTIRYRIIGFMSDNLKMSGRYLMAIPVYLNDDKILNIIEERMVDAIVVDSVKMNFIKNSDLIDELLDRGVKLITLSPAEELEKEKVNGKDFLPRNILIEDLLSKEPVKEDIENLAPLFKGKRILITGAAGSIGRELVKQLSVFHPGMFILVDQAETPLHDLRLMLKDDFGELLAYTIVADITNLSRMESLFAAYRPEYVFHFAAYKHIPMLEMDISEAIQVNVMGTCNLADLAARYDVKHFVMASTDNVISPDTVMGVSKRIAEKYILAFAGNQEIKGADTTRYIVTRFGNILDSNGSVLLRFKEQIARKENLIVTHPDVVRRFLTVREVARLVLEAFALADNKAIYTFDAGRPVKILDLAKRMISLSGYTPGKEIKIEYSGLRAGEKLSEIKFVSQNCVPTIHKKIFAVQEVNCEYAWIDSQVRILFKESYEGDTAKMMSVIKEIIPEFISNECICDKFTINNN